MRTDVLVRSNMDTMYPRNVVQSHFEEEAC